jgi:outer membrane scaffolding protein for murein synthesis (MipA/OmpV family)
MSSRTLWAGLLTGAAALTPLPALAAEPDVPPPAAAEALWEVGVGAGLLRLPHYRGSRQFNTWCLPVPYLVYRGDWFRSDRDGTRAVLMEDAHFDLDLSFYASAPVNSRDNQARTGMADLSPTVEVGPNLNLALERGAGWTLDLRAPLRAVATLRAPRGVIGWSATPVINLDLTTPWADVGLQAGPLWGNGALHRHYYSVSGADISSERPAFEARGGYGGWQATSSLSHRWGDVWLGAYLRFDSVAGAVFEHSPLVTARQTLAFGVGISWIGARSSERVTRKER